MDPLVPLKGGVSTVFTFGRIEDYADAVEQARAEQELVCGYPLVVLSTRQVQYQDKQGRDVFEVYATFGPAPDPDPDLVQGEDP